MPPWSRSRPVDEVVGDLALLAATVLPVSPLDERAARRAALLRTRHYSRTARPVSLTDCAAAALALQEGLPLATSDAPLAALVREEGGAVVPLPDSAGRLP